MKKYTRLIAAFCIGVAVLALTMAAIRFFQSWLPANGFQISKEVFVIVSMGVLGAAFAMAARLCLDEARKIEVNQPRQD